VIMGTVFFAALLVGNVSAQNSIGKIAATNVTLNASTTTPAVGQPVTFTAVLKSGSKPLSAKPVTIYHYFDGVRYDDVTNKSTNASGQVNATATFESAGPRNYYATFAGDSSYGASMSSILAINVR
jgi:Bacterial Ig-like domain (group 3)